LYDTGALEFTVKMMSNEALKKWNVSQGFEALKAAEATAFEGQVSPYS